MAPPETPGFEISVGTAGASLPYSKGVLAQSLLAAAIDPSDAFSIAREIERQLEQSGASRIARSELRALAHATLRERAGALAAERYLVWRRYEEPERPVVLLIGGTSGVGKTALALEVARRMGIARVLSTDSIRQVMRLLISSELVPAIHGSSYDAHKLLPTDGGEPPSVIDGFRAQAAAVAVGVRASLDRTVDEGANVVIDGVSLLPGMIDQNRYAGRATVVFCLVVTREDSVLRDRFAVRARGQKRRAPHRYLDNFDAILEIQRYLVDQADRRGIPVIDNLELDASARRVIGHVLDAVRRSGAHAKD